MVRLRSPQVPCPYTREPGGRGTRGEVTKEEERFLSSQADPSQERREGKSRPAAFGMTGVGGMTEKERWRASRSEPGRKRRETRRYKTRARMAP